MPPAPATDRTTGDGPSRESQDTIITPLKVTVQEKTADHAAPKGKDPRNRMVLVSGLLILILGGLGLLSYLSRNPLRTVYLSGETPPSKLPEQALPAALSPPTADENEGAENGPLDRKGAEQKLADFLQAKKTLDEKGAAGWGGAAYAQALTLSEAADAAFIRGEFPAASRDYGEALLLLSELLSGIDTTLERLLAQAEQALREGDGKQAEQLYSRALMIDPGNKSALHNLERAGKSEAVMKLIASGARHEQKNNPAGALADYQEAVRLDPDSEKAKSALHRVENLIAAEQFRHYMSSGFKALKEKDYPAARSAFLKARSFRPDAHEVHDALVQVDTAIRLARIETLREKGLAAERTEQWPEALASYEEVLSLDASIQFALHGKERSLKRSELDASLNYYLEKPAVLESDQSLARAIALLEEAGQIQPQSPRLARQLKRLDALVREAQTPVAVTIVSDSLTDVAIYKVGKLGRFTTRELNLRPGTYTIVGARKGFKDVRQTIAVRAGEGPVQISLQCSEKI